MRQQLAAGNLSVLAAARPKPACEEAEAASVSRRRLLAGATLSLAAASLLPASPLPALADGATLVDFLDEKDKFSLQVPDGWASGEGDLTPNTNRFSNTAGMSRVVGFAPPGRPDVNISVTITNIGADYTALGSFGNAQTFGENLVGSMDRSYLLRGPAWARRGEVPQVATLQGAKESQGMYYLDYTVKTAEEPARVISSVVAIGNNGRQRRFYTVNATCMEGDVAEYGPLLKSIINSFKAPSP